MLKREKETDLVIPSPAPSESFLTRLLVVFVVGLGRDLRGHELVLEAAAAPTSLVLSSPPRGRTERDLGGRRRGQKEDEEQQCV